MYRANELDLVTNKAKSMPTNKERTINTLNECHRHIYVKSNLNNDRTNKMANMIDENYKLLNTIH